MCTFCCLLSTFTLTRLQYVPSIRRWSCFAAPDNRIRDLVVSVTGSTSTTGSRRSHSCYSSVFFLSTGNRIVFGKLRSAFYRHFKSPAVGKKYHTLGHLAADFYGTVHVLRISRQLDRRTCADDACALRVILVSSWSFCAVQLCDLPFVSKGLLAGRTAFQSRYRSENAATDDGRNKTRLFWTSKRRF